MIEGKGNETNSGRTSIIKDTANKHKEKNLNSV